MAPAEQRWVGSVDVAAFVGVATSARLEERRATSFAAIGIEIAKVRRLALDRREAIDFSQRYPHIYGTEKKLNERVAGSSNLCLE
jgi:hypothetical protein